MLEIGKEYYYIERLSQSVQTGRLSTLGADMNSGYLMGYFLTGKIVQGKKETNRVESVLIFDTQDEAIDKLNEMKPLEAEGKAVETEANKKIKEIREKVIGKPEFEDMI